MHQGKSKNKMDRGKSKKRTNNQKGPEFFSPDLFDFKNSEGVYCY